MSAQDELLKLEQELKVLESRKLELTLKAEAEAKAAPASLTLVKIENDRLFFSLSKYDDKFIQMFRTILGRNYHPQDKHNSIPLDSLEDLVAKVQKMNEEGGIGSEHPTPLTQIEGDYATVPTYPFTFHNGTQEELDKLLNRPLYIIKLNGRETKLDILLNNNPPANFITHIPGYKIDYSRHNTWTIPIAEGWRLYQSFAEQGITRVEWEDEALQAARTELENRKRLDEVATKQDSSILPELNLNLELRNYQKVGVEFSEATGFRLIIADQPGLGKTPQAIAISRLISNRLGRPCRTAVICPANLKRNWAKQIDKWVSEGAKIYKGREPSMNDIESLMVDKPKWCIFNYDILGSKTEFFNERTDESTGQVFKSDIHDRYVWAEYINLSQFDLIVIDEAHYIKNVESHRSKAVRLLATGPRILFLTATPVTNRPRELWPMLTMINPKQYPSNESFLWTYEDNYGNAKNSAQLVQLLKGVMIRRLTKDVVQELPPINRIYEFYELSPKATRLYNKVLSGIYQELAELGGVEGNQTAITSILAQITRLKQVCAIDKMDSVAELATGLYDNGDQSHNKVLIFSQFVPVARGISRRLGNEAIVVTGETSPDERVRLVKEFMENPDVHFLVATNRVLGEGFDITAAGHVVFADLFWTPAAHEQCEGRAYGRISDLHSINSYYCVAQLEGEEESIENWIQQLLAKKLVVIEQTVDGINTDRNNSVANELIEKMKDQMFTSKRKK